MGLMANFMLDESDDDSDEDSVIVYGSALCAVLHQANRHRIQNYVSDVVAHFTAVEFRRVFRVSVDCFQHLCQLLSACQEMTVRPNVFWW